MASPLKGGFFLLRKMRVQLFYPTAGVAAPNKPVEQIGKIQIPILLIHGERDQIIAPGQLDKLHEKIKSAEKLLIEGICMNLGIVLPEIKVKPFTTDEALD